MENGRFACCSSWFKCPILGYCVYCDYVPPGKEDRRRTNVFNCSLGNNLFVSPVKHIAEAFQASAKELVQREGIVVEEQPLMKELFDTQLAEYRARHSTQKSTPQDTPLFSIAGIKLRNGVLEMPKYKVVDQKDGLVLVSWMYKDITHYGIQEFDGEMLEIFVPTSSLRGQALRAHAIQVFNSRVEEDYIGKWPIAATSVSELQEGHVLVYESQIGRVSFALVTKIMPSLIVSVTNVGSEALWLPAMMDSKILQQKVQVIDRENVPLKFNTFPEEMKI